MKQWWQTFQKNDIRNVLAIIVMLGCFAIVVLLLFIPIPANNKDIVNSSLGYFLGGALGAVVGYYYAANKTNNNNTNQPQ